MVAASCAAEGSATPVNLFAPRATSAPAAPKPLNGIFVLSSLALVTLASKILAVVTLASLILAVSTASLAKSPTTIVPSKIIPVVTLLAPIVETPALSIVTSPVIVTSAAWLVPSPR